MSLPFFKHQNNGVYDNMEPFYSEESEYTAYSEPVIMPEHDHMLVHIVACLADGNVIGHGGGLPWSAPLDMKRFRAMTTSKAVIMGRGTYDSIGGPLAGRYNIVVTTNYMEERPMRVKRVRSFMAALEHAEEMCFPEVFVIGGQSVYEQALPYADFLRLTELHLECVGDRFFPELDCTEWTEIQRAHQTGNVHQYDFVDYIRTSRTFLTPFV